MRIFRDFETGENAPDDARLAEGSHLHANLAGVGAIVVLASARGGVGKSSITVNLAATLALTGRKVGILDADLNSPSIVAMLGMKPLRRMPAMEGIEPGAGPLGLRIAASNLLPEGEPAPMSFVDFDETPAARGNGGLVELGYSATLRRLLANTRFGMLDFLLIDLAPGLEQVYRIARLVPRASLVVISHPSELSSRAAKEALEFAANSSIAIIGIIENMAGFSCDGCHSVRPLMPQGALATLAREARVPMLERLPFDPRFAESSDRGTFFVREHAETPLAKQLIALAASLDHAGTTIRAERPEQV